MKNTFRSWNSVGTYEIDTVMDYILTGRKASEAKPDEWILSNLGSPESNLSILDFGCGVGRNTFGVAFSFPTWKVVGYDNDNMLLKTSEFFNLHYYGLDCPNVGFSSAWEDIRQQRFDVIFCCLVFQHIYEEPLAEYIQNFKQMTHKLIVCGRRANDEKRRSTWTILDENGLTPSVFYKNGLVVGYEPEGSPEEHHAAVYTI